MPDTHEGTMANPRRKNDPESENHSRDRRFDWRELAPRWALVLMVATLLGSTMYLFGRNSGLYDERMEILAKYQSDARWDLLSRLSEEQGIQRARLNHHESQLQQLTKAADDISEIRADVRVLKRLAESRGR